MSGGSTVVWDECFHTSTRRIKRSFARVAKFTAAKTAGCPRGSLAELDTLVRVDQRRATTPGRHAPLPGRHTVTARCQTLPLSLSGGGVPGAQTRRIACGFGPPAGSGTQSRSIAPNPLQAKRPRHSRECEHAPRRDWQLHRRLGSRKSGAAEVRMQRPPRGQPDLGCRLRHRRRRHPPERRTSVRRVQVVVKPRGTQRLRTPRGKQ